MPKIVQITASHGTLYALDDEGQVWSRLQIDLHGMPDMKCEIYWLKEPNLNEKASYRQADRIKPRKIELINED